MKQVYVYSLALVLALATLAVPARANGTASTNVFTVTMQDFPDEVLRGGEVSGTVTITMAPDARTSRRLATYTFYVTTPLGDAVVKSGSLTLRADQPRTIKISQPVDDAAPPGLYQIKLVVTIDSSSASIGHDVTVLDK